MREDRSIPEMLTANFTFVDERLARHYGIPNITGNDFRRVTLTDRESLRIARAGKHSFGHVLPQSHFACGARQMGDGADSGRDRSSAASERAGAQRERGGAKPQSVRERLEVHRSMEPCASCHKLMDPIGFSLENFDAVGAWRTTDLRLPNRSLRASCTTAAKVDGPVSLRNALVARSDLFVRGLTVKLLTYALGRGVEYYDMPTVRSIERDSRKEQLPFFLARLGHREERSVPDVQSGGGSRRER